MTITKRWVEVESFFLVAMVAAGSLFFAIRSNNHQPQFNIASSSSSVPSQAEIVSSKVIISSQISPDGVKKVIMKITENPDNTITHDLSTADINGANEQHIFTKTLGSSKSMTIPFNAWSPDDQYFFIEENAGSNKNTLVFRVDGVRFAGGEIYLDVVGLFNQGNTGYNFDEATGWASESLSIINTKKSDGGKGPSYWLEIPSKAIIPLSTEF
jgi:hypothetical protein